MALVIALLGQAQASMDAGTVTRRAGDRTMRPRIESRQHPIAVLECTLEFTQGQLAPIQADEHQAWK